MTDHRSIYNRTDPTQGAYNGFTLDDRGKASKWTRSNPAGRPYHPSWCHSCGQTEGLIYWHNEDYRTPGAPLPLCPWCHWTLHSRLKPNQAHVFPEYLNMLDVGWRPPPVRAGTRWPAWRRLFLDTPADRWPTGDTLGRRAENNLFHLVLATPTTYVPAHLSVLDGGEPLEGQWPDWRVFDLVNLPGRRDPSLDKVLT